MIGKLVNSVLDKILPDVVGDIVGMAVDTLASNYAGAGMNALDAVEDIFEAAGADGAAEFMQQDLGFGSGEEAAVGGTI